MFGLKVITLLKLHTGNVKKNKFRFFIIAMYCMLSFSNGMQWVTFSPIADKFKVVYNLTTITLDLFSMSYMIISTFVNFPASYIIDNKSTRLGVNTS